ncbi:ParB/RepB/Spo0J family partition protein [Streptomyces sp. AV19]|uniref:ParB/RepB/Spo0J family partition protein n=1 Tax=Streptomyces sp. AV19 TaxID=2793068 RepID=UPI0018FE4F17|nr:ParB/RepB/Spo0J family partition protein [Streptomyces sp. AV19]MBH1939018.1 ParB/RepB/Spo0J family partition protein [Streptomyces sp. AV19]MDG4532459.1 ParB/RepB/Spo0J family partition protein [Streptomyces sp. AV19]
MGVVDRPEPLSAHQHHREDPVLPPGKGAYELRRVRLTAIALTPLNPRRTFGTDEERTVLGESLRKAQLAPCVAVSRPAYLKLWPEHIQGIGDADYVLINGERRYHSALHVGLEELDFAIRDDLATSREDLVNYVLTENLEREDFDVMERARGVQQLVNACAENSAIGAQSRAAERLGRNRSWVTNQLALLRLPAEIQDMLSSGELPERDGRRLARHHKQHPELSTADLLSHWKVTRPRRERTPRELPSPRTAPADSAHPERPLPTDNTTLVPLMTAGQPRTTRPGIPHSVVPAAALLVRRLGTTPRDQARTLAAGLDARSLRELFEALRRHL